MRISARCSYAIKAMIELTYRYQEKIPMQAQEISRNQSIPENFLVQILLQLKSAKLIKSIRGKHGGYLLAVHPTRATLGEVVRLIEGTVLDTNEESENSEKSTGEDTALQKIWEEVDTKIFETLDNVTFEDLACRCRENQYIPDYVI